MTSRWLLAVLMMLPLWATAAVGDLVAPKYQITVSGTKYFDPASWCDAYRASQGLTDRSCVNTSVGSTSANQLNQTWNYAYKITATGTVSSNQTYTASAYCDPAYYTGPAPYNTADQSKYWCKVVTDPPPVCKPGIVGVYNWRITIDANGHPTSGPPIVGSDGTCEIRLTGVHYCWQATDGNAYCKYDTVTTGNVRGTSVPDVPPSVANPPADMGNTAGTQQSGPLPGQPGGGCPKGMVNAGLDSGGTPICLGTGYDRPSTTTPATTTTSAPTTTSNADGSTTTVQNTTTTNTDGTKTTVTTTVVTAADGSKTQTQTSSTTARPDGSTGVASSPTDKSNLCSQNPNLTICQNSTVAGDCTTGFSCTGDAIQCATLRAAAAMQCKQAKDDADLKAAPASTLGASVLAGSDPAGSTLPSPSKATAVTMPGTLDQTGWLGAGQCFADKVVTVQGRTFVLPYSKACDYLIVLRLGLMVVASLVSFRIVRDAVLT